MTLLATQPFTPGRWQDAIDVRDFVQHNYTPYTGDGAFLAGPTDRTLAVWDRVAGLMDEERRRGGVLDIDVATPAGITAHAPGYIDRDHELIVGLQTDAPLKRAIMPNGGWRMVESGLRAYGYEPDPHVAEIFTRYRKTHNDGVFDAYTPAIRAARRSGLITGLPDAYGRGRIIGDYRRVPLYGVDRLIEAKRAERAEIDERFGTEEVIRAREELSEQIRALEELAEMAAGYGHDVRRPAADAREAIQWLYLAYLAAIKEQNGAAMSLGRTATFLDCYLDRDLAAGALDEASAQELIDDFVIKLRSVRFLRTPEYDELFSGDPTWVTETLGGIGDDGRPLVTRTSFRYLQTLYNLGPAPEPNLTVLWSHELPEGFKRFCAQVSIDTSAIQYESDECIRPRFGDDTAIACCVSAMRVGKQMQFFGARVNLAKALLYALNGGRDEVSGAQVATPSEPVTADVLDFNDVWSRLDATLDWLAETYVHALNVIHYMHDKYAYERLEMALHDRDVLRTMACGVAGLSVAADSLSAIKFAQVRPVRDETGLIVDYEVDGSVPGLRQRRRPRRLAGRATGRDVHGQGPPPPDVPRRGPHPVRADDHVERRLRAPHRRDARRAGRRRAVRPGREPDERPRPARRGRRRALGRQAPVRGRRGRHLAHGVDHSGRAGAAAGRAGREPDRPARRLRDIGRLPHERQRARPRDARGRDGAPRALPAAHDPRVRLRRQLRPAHARAAAGRDRADVPHGAVT